ncbi:MAG TPA: T9SS type A sorting domain-containing protein, partial [Draconibacterium sp.]|nr:T9SS type A sorting domain-containing protein [Draconibacterium sp.]
YWLDPLKSGVQTLDGKQFNEGEELCMAFTNLNNTDKYSFVPIVNSNKFEGYWGGSNNIGITEFMERFSILGNEVVSGVSLGVGKFKNVLKSTDSEIKIKIYNGSDLPEQLIYSQTVRIADFAADAMNFIGFSENVQPDETFFVGFELSNIQPLDSFVIYQSLRTVNDINTFYYMQNSKWYNFKDANPTAKSIVNILEIVICNIDDIGTDTPLVDNPLDIFVFPNPTNSSFIFEAGQDILENRINVYNLLGQKIDSKIRRITKRKVNIDLTGNVPGVYFVRFDSGKEVFSRKISFVPW